MMANETHKMSVKDQYDWFIHPHVFVESDLVLLYYQDHDKLGAGKFEPL